MNKFTKIIWGIIGISLLNIMYDFRPGVNARGGGLTGFFLCIPTLLLIILNFAYIKHQWNKNSNQNVDSLKKDYLEIFLVTTICLILTLCFAFYIYLVIN